MFAVEFRNYRKKIKDNIILDIDNLDLDEGKKYGFLGINGSGKTMLFRAISGLIRPSSGYVKVFGSVIGKEMSFPSELGLMLEHVGFWPQLTGYENLKFLAEIRNVIDDDTIFAQMERIGLTKIDAMSKYRTYSLGMKQKLAIAQAIMESPKLLILDEPTNSLDEESVCKLHNILSEEKTRGATILISSHHKDDLLICDKTYKMSGGTCVEYPIEV